MRVEFTYNNRNEPTEARRYDAATAGTKVSSTDFGFDDGGRLTSEVHKDGAGIALVTYGNAYDAANRITTDTRNGTPKNFAYDVNSQVTSDGTNSYSNDANGNRTMAGYVTGAANRTTSDGTWTYTHNAEGNITKRSKGASLETWTYGYDHNNRLLWVEMRDSDGGVLRTRVDYKYDALNNRIFDKLDQYSAGGILLSSVTSKHTFDGQNVYADLDNAGAITTRYLLGDYLGERYGRTDSSSAFWLLTDRLGSVREVLTLAGALSSVIAYDAFGNILSESNPATSGNYLFTGLLYWRATGMYGTPNREYLAALGKWLQEDFIGFAAGDPNLGRYAGNNGTNATDLSGLQDNRFSADNWRRAEREFANHYNPPRYPTFNGLGRVPMALQSSANQDWSGSPFYLLIGRPICNTGVLLWDAAHCRDIDRPVTHDGLRAFYKNPDDWRTWSSTWISATADAAVTFSVVQPAAPVFRMTANAAGYPLRFFRYADDVGSVGLPGSYPALAPASSAGFRQTFATGSEWYEYYAQQYGVANVEWVSGSGRTITWPSQLPLPANTQMFRVRPERGSPARFAAELETVAGPRPLGGIAHHNQPLMLNGIDNGAVNGSWQFSPFHQPGHNVINGQVLWPRPGLPYGTEIRILPRPPRGN